MRSVERRYTSHCRHSMKRTASPRKILLKSDYWLLSHDN